MHELRIAAGNGGVNGVAGLSPAGEIAGLKTAVLNQRLSNQQRKLAKLRRTRGLIGEPDIGGVSSHRQIVGRGIQVRRHGGLAASRQRAAVR